MNSFLAAAHRVLTEERCTLTAGELVSLATARGYLETSGRTPSKTMNARLSEDILHNKETSAFMRTDSGRFALREWISKPYLQEYVAPRRTLALFDEDILVFGKEKLRCFMPEDGIKTANIDWDGLIGETYSMRRQEAENDFDVIQLVSVYIVKYKDKFITHKRSKRLPEKRLHNVYSMFFGGHLNPDDVMPLFNFANSAVSLEHMVRELYEELRIPPNNAALSLKGLIYDPRTEVSTQHIGIIFECSLSKPDFQIGERGFLTDPKFETKSEIMKRIADFENWSELLVKDLVL